MSDYIDRQAAIEAVGDIHPLDYNSRAIVERLKNLPSADVEPVRHGRWEVFYAEELCGYRHAYYVCSSCFSSSDDEFDYCPYCGARMDGEQGV